MLTSLWSNRCKPQLDFGKKLAQSGLQRFRYGVQRLLQLNIITGTKLGVMNNTSDEDPLKFNEELFIFISSSSHGIFVSISTTKK